MARILIVDDSSVMRKNLSSILTQAGHEVIGEAGNGYQAIKMYLELKPDLVTMDMSMPIMGGVEAVGKIIDEDQEAKIIVISALNQKHMVFEALNNGAKHYIIKPIDINKVISVVNEVLDQPAKEKISSNEQQTIEDEKPGFTIENKNGQFIVLFNEHMGIKDQVSLDTAIKGLLFIKPLHVVFDFSRIGQASDEVISNIMGLGKKIEEAGGYFEYIGKGNQ